MSVSNHYPLILDLEGVGGEGGVRGDRDGEDMWTQGLFISMYDKIHYKKKKKKNTLSLLQPLTSEVPYF